MPKTSVKPHLTKEEIKERMTEAKSLDQFKRWQVLYMRLSHPGLALQSVADDCGVEYRTVTQWTWMYNKFGPDAYCLAGRGGRHRELLSLEDEQRVLDELIEKAEMGQVVTAQVVRKKAEQLLGHEVSKDYAYDLLHRHNWRKVQPRPYHPKQDTAKQAAFKKTSKTCWMPSGKP